MAVSSARRLSPKETARAPRPGRRTTHLSPALPLLRRVSQVLRGEGNRRSPLALGRMRPVCVGRGRGTETGRLHRPPVTQARGRTMGAGAWGWCLPLAPLLSPQGWSPGYLRLVPLLLRAEGRPLGSQCSRSRLRPTWGSGPPSRPPRPRPSASPAGSSRERGPEIDSAGPASSPRLGPRRKRARAPTSLTAPPPEPRRL